MHWSLKEFAGEAFGRRLVSSCQGKAIKAVGSSGCLGGRGLSGAVALLSLLLLVSCVSDQQVHLFSKGVSQEELVRVGEALQESGFEVRPNALEIPGQIARNTIIYPPVIGDPAILDALQSSLAKVGFPNTELVYGTLGEHYYSTDNIGLYLVNTDFVEQTEMNDGNESLELVGIYYSDCDETESELSLFAQGVGILEVFVWNEKANEERSTPFDGEWTVTGSTVALNLPDLGSIEFEVSEFEGRDDYGRYHGVRLESLRNESVLANCDFQFVTY